MALAVEILLAETQAHIEAQRRLRELIMRAIATAWTSLAGYDRSDVPAFLATVVPLIFAGQRQAVYLSDAYVARALERQPLGVDSAAVIAQLRNGTPPTITYQRPFVTVWSRLEQHRPWQDAVVAGEHHATSAAAMDIQLAHRGALQAVNDADPQIRSWQRVADPDACAFCRLVDGAKLLSPDALPLHAHCGCGIAPRTEPADPTPLPAGVAVREHGEYGPTLGDPAHAFKGPDDIPQQ